MLAETEMVDIVPKLVVVSTTLLVNCVVLTDVLELLGPILDTELVTVLVPGGLIFGAVVLFSCYSSLL